MISLIYTFKKILLIPVFLLGIAGCSTNSPLSSMGDDPNWNIDNRYAAIAIKARLPDKCLELPHALTVTNPWDGDVGTYNARHACLWQYVKEIKNHDVCKFFDESKDPQDYRNCLQYFANLYSDPKLCEPRKNDADAPLGYLRCVARASLDEEKCFDIPRLGTHSPEILARALGECLADIGGEKKDYRICKRINGPKFGREGDDTFGSWRDFRNGCLIRIARCEEEERNPSIPLKDLCNLAIEEELSPKQQEEERNAAEKICIETKPEPCPSTRLKLPAITQ